MSQETRTVRPFEVAPTVTAFFSEATLRVGELICPADSSVAVDLDPHVFSLQSVAFSWNSDGRRFEESKTALLEGLAAIDIKPGDAVLRLAATAPYLGLVETVYERTVAELEGMPISVDLSPRQRFDAFQAVHHGYRVDSYVMLAKTRDRRLLGPWRGGTWLAHARFGVTTQEARSMFRPLPLTEDRRAEFGLQAKTMRFFSMGDHDPLEPYGNQAEKPVLFVDEDLLAELSASPNSAPSATIQLQLVCDFLSAVINNASRRDELRTKAPEDLVDSLLGRVVRAVAGPRSDDQQNLLELVRTDPERASAQAEHTVDLRGRALQMLHGNG